MNSLADLGRLFAQKTWNKDVVIWIGPEAPIREAAAGAGQPIKVAELDLLDLLDETALPETEPELAAALKSALRADLRKRAPKSYERHILIVRSAPLLTRYSLGLREFFDWFVGDHALVVLVLGGVPAPGRPLPPEIELRPEWLLQSLHQTDHAKHVFSAS